MQTAKTMAKFNKIKETLSEFDNHEADLQISALSPTFERLGSIWNNPVSIWNKFLIG